MKKENMINDIKTFDGAKRKSLLNAWKCNWCKKFFPVPGYLHSCNGIFYRNRTRKRRGV